MDWERFIKKYVWDDDKTPYFVPVAKLTKYQANHELLAYTVFLALLFTVFAVVSLNEDAPYGKSYGVSVYSLSVAAAAVVFGATKHVLAACYVSAAPLATLAYLLFWGFPPHTASIDKVFLVVVVVLFLRYSLRVVSIAKSYPGMPERKSE